MNVLSAYLWKEWRDQRVQVIGFALLVPLLLAIALVSVPGTWARADALPTFIAAGGLLIAALTIASDLVPGEMRRGRIDFLARMPGDLRSAFVAKLLFGVGALALFCLYGWFCATVLSASIGGGKWFVPFEWTFTERIESEMQSHDFRWSLLDPLVVFAAWTFAVSCWLSRGTLAVPAALLVLSLIGAPAAIAVLKHPDLSIHTEELRALRFWLPATALLAAALSFLRGTRHGRKPLRVIGWALVGTLVAATPVWAWTGLRWSDYTSLDLASDSLAIHPVALGDGGRFVFANVQSQVLRFGRTPEDEANHAVVIDLEDGTARATGGLDSRFELLWRQRSVRTTPLVLVFDSASEHQARPYFSGPFECSDAFDARNGTPMRGEPWKELLRTAGSIEGLMGRANGFVRLPDGSHCWMTGRTLNVEARSGALTMKEFKVAPPSWSERWRPCGAGFRFGPGGGFIDLATRTFVSQSAVVAITSRALDGSATNSAGDVVSIGPNGWLLRLPRGRRGTEHDYALWSPGESAARPATGIAADEWVLAAASDGRVLVDLRETGGANRPKDREMAWVDPTTGARVPVRRPAEITAPAVAWPIGTLPSGALVCVLQWRAPARLPWPMRLARIDADGSMGVTAEVRTSMGSGVIGCPDESTVVVLCDGGRIVRAKFDGSPSEVVFPRAAVANRTSSESGAVGVPK